MKPFASLVAGFFCAALPAPAYAHVGHFGELAGHSHWVGAAAVAGAALVAGLVAWKDRKRKQEEPDRDAEAQDSEIAGDGAQ